MSKIVLEELEHPPGSYPPQPWQGSVDYLRVDPHEFSIPTTFYYDWVRVTADDEANSQFAIKFSTKDIDNVGSNVTTIFYYSATNPSSGGTEIGRVTLNGSSYLLWDTSQVPNGSYFVYGIVTDGLNSTTAKASGKITINHSRPQDTTLPILFLDAPLQNSTVYNNFVLKGYALDNIQTAGGQLYIDNVLISEFSTGLFDSRAQEAYRSLAESGNAGFYHPLDLSFLSPGPHFIEVKVYDTAGNVTSNVVQVIKSQGSDPNPLQPPVALNLPEVKRTVGDNGVNIPDNTKGPTPTPTPTRTATPRAPNNSPSPRLPPSPSPLPNSLALSVKAPRGRKILEATVTKGSKCKRVTVVGALTANLLETSGSGVQLGGKKGSARTVFRLSNLRRRFSGAKNIFLRAFCDSTSVSRVRKVKLPR
jgi:cyclophilin family peptidyl-prolyl cis-trans isomerase